MMALPQKFIVIEIGQCRTNYRGKKYSSCNRLVKWREIVKVTSDGNKARFRLRFSSCWRSLPCFCVSRALCWAAGLGDVLEPGARPTNMQMRELLFLRGPDGIWKRVFRVIHTRAGHQCIRVQDKMRICMKSWMHWVMMANDSYRKQTKQRFFFLG